MPKVKCAICKTEDWAEYMYYCPNCQMWICSGCVMKAGIFGLKYECPRCGRTLPGK